MSMGDITEDKADIIEIENEITNDLFDVTSLYKEKNWGKDASGKQIVDGYSFRGKQSFLKVVEGFKSILIK